MITRSAGLAIPPTIQTQKVKTDRVQALFPETDIQIARGVAQVWSCCPCQFQGSSEDITFLL
jgi:hypothetical protein